MNVASKTKSEINNKHKIGKLMTERYDCAFRHLLLVITCCTYIYTTSSGVLILLPFTVKYVAL